MPANELCRNCSLLILGNEPQDKQTNNVRAEEELTYKCQNRNNFILFYIF